MAYFRRLWAMSTIWTSGQMPIMTARHVAAAPSKPKSVRKPMTGRGLVIGASYRPGERVGLRAAGSGDAYSTLARERGDRMPIDAYRRLTGRCGAQVGIS